MGWRLFILGMAVGSDLESGRNYKPSAPVAYCGACGSGPWVVDAVEVMNEAKKKREEAWKNRRKRT